MKPSTLTATVLFCSTLSITALAGPDLTLEEVPDAVRATIERELKGTAIKEIEWEEDAQEPHYEVEYEVAGVEWELEVTEDGRVLKHEQD